MIELPRPHTVASGYFLPECPRWHDGALYFSDIAGGAVYRLGEGGAELVYRSADDFVGGLGFAPDGALLVVHSKARQVVRVVDGQARKHADLSGLCAHVLNDMVVSAGRCYIGQPGFNIWAEEANGLPPLTELLMVDTDGTARVAATDLGGPNGIAVSPDGRRLYVAESTAMRISTFAIDPATGALSDRQLFAQLPGGTIPDGMCLDDSGAVWAATPVSWSGGAMGEGLGVIRIAPDGTPTHVVPMAPGRRALACAFGGAARDTLYICTVPAFEGASAHSAAEGAVEAVDLGATVRWRGAGIP